MRFIKLLTFIWLACGAPVVSTGPVPGRGLVQSPLTAEEVACETIEKYTTQWFLNNTRSEYLHPLTDTALFYSRGMSEQAIKFADSRGMITIWEVWPCELYVYHEELSNPMRCIHSTPELRTAFYGNMSKAFAIKAGGLVTVMHSEEDYDEPPTDGIWATIELPTMKESNAVAWIKKIDSIGKRSEVVWKRIENLWAAATNHFRSTLSENIGFIKKRNLRSSSYCMRPSEYKFFDNINW